MGRTHGSLKTKPVLIQAMVSPINHHLRNLKIGVYTTKPMTIRNITVRFPLPRHHLITTTDTTTDTTADRIV